MKNKFTLLLVTLFTALTSVNAQDLSTCKNICEKKKIVESDAFLGVRFNCCPCYKNAKIQEVLQNTAASKFGFVTNDMIQKVDNTEIVANQQLLDIIDKHLPGDVVTIEYMHDQKIFSKNVVLGAKTQKEVTEKVCCDEESKLTDISNAIFIRPNPASSNVIVTSDVMIKGDVEINILSITGVSMQTKKVSCDGLLNTTLNVSNLIAGQYFIKIISPNNQYVTKLEIAR